MNLTCDGCGSIFDSEDQPDYSSDDSGIHCEACEARHFMEGMVLAAEYAADREAAKTICRRCGQEMNDRDESEGCEDHFCPMRESVF